MSSVYISKLQSKCISQLLGEPMISSITSYKHLQEHMHNYLPCSGWWGREALNSKRKNEKTKQLESSIFPSTCKGKVFSGPHGLKITHILLGPLLPPVVPLKSWLFFLKSVFYCEMKNSKTLTTISLQEPICKGILPAQGFHG